MTALLRSLKSAASLGAVLLLTAFAPASAEEVSASSAPAPSAETLPEVHVPVERFKLKNGMEGLVIVRPKVPAVLHAVWYRVGAADEIPGKSGLAHFFEHLMFKGTEAFPKGQLSRDVASAGGNDNAFTFHDVTGYYQFVPKERLKDVMTMEADRMRGLTFEPQEIERERKVVLEERLMRTDNVPESRLWERIQAGLFLNSPYGRPVIGWPHEIKALTEADLRAFYDNYYRPDNALVVIAGDITPEEAKALAEDVYGGLQAPDKSIQRPVFAQEPTDLPPLPARYVLEDPHAGADKWIRAYTAPGWTPEASQEAYTYAALAELLTGGEDSPLIEEIVTKRKLAVGLDASYDPVSRSRTDFTLSAAAAPGHAPSEVEAAVMKFLTERQDLLFTAENVSAVKDRMIASRIFASEDLRTLAHIYGKCFAVTGSTEPVDGWSKGIAAVTPEALRNALSRLLAGSYAAGELIQTKAKK